jgi:hypothetical protein
VGLTQIEKFASITLEIMHSIRQILGAEKHFKLERMKLILRILILAALISELAFTIFICYASYKTTTLDKNSEEYEEYSGTLINFTGASQGTLYFLLAASLLFSNWKLIETLNK